MREKIVLTLGVLGPHCRTSSGYIHVLKRLAAAAAAAAAASAMLSQLMMRRYVLPCVWNETSSSSLSRRHRPTQAAPIIAAFSLPRLRSGPVYLPPAWFPLDASYTVCASSSDASRRAARTAADVNAHRALIRIDRQC